jgi:hypothetical protein
MVRVSPVSIRMGTPRFGAELHSFAVTLAQVARRAAAGRTSGMRSSREVDNRAGHDLR